MQKGPYLNGGFFGTQISGDNLGGYNQPGLNLGIGLVLPFRNDLGLDQSLEFVQKGSRKNQNPDRGDYTTYFLRMNYLAYHLSVKKQFSKVGLAIGSQVAYFINAKEEVNGFEFLTREFKPYDLTLFLNVSYAFHSNWEAIFGIDQGIVPVRDHPVGTAFKWNKGQYTEALKTGMRYYFGGKN